MFHSVKTKKSIKKTVENDVANENLFSKLWPFFFFILFLFLSFGWFCCRSSLIWKSVTMDIQTSFFFRLQLGRRGENATDFRFYSSVNSGVFIPHGIRCIHKNDQNRLIKVPSMNNFNCNAVRDICGISPNECDTFVILYHRCYSLLICSMMENGERGW